MHPSWSRHEAQPHVLADKVLHIAALIVVVEFQKDPACHTIRQLGEIVEGTKNPGAVEICGRNCRTRIFRTKFQLYQLCFLFQIIRCWKDTFLYPWFFVSPRNYGFQHLPQEDRLLFVILRSQVSKSKMVILFRSWETYYGRQTFIVLIIIGSKIYVNSINIYIISNDDEDYILLLLSLLDLCNTLYRWESFHLFLGIPMTSCWLPGYWSLPLFESAR